MLLPSLFNFEFFFFFFFYALYTKKKWDTKIDTESSLVFIGKKKIVKERMHGEELLCAENIKGSCSCSPQVRNERQERAWRNHMFTMLERAWRKHIFSIPGLVTLKPEPGENMSNFTWYFQTPLAQGRSFSFQYLIANIIKKYPQIFFRLQPHYFSISESNKKKRKKKEFWNGRQEN